MKLRTDHFDPNVTQMQICDIHNNIVNAVKCQFFEN